MQSRMHATLRASLLVSLVTFGLTLRPDTSRVINEFYFGSCNKHDREQRAWDAILSRSSERENPLFVWLGDIVYADRPVIFKVRIPANATGLQHHYALQKARPDYTRFRERSEIIGVYDDHDYGQNDGDKHFYAPTRAASKQLFWDFIDEPPNSSRREQDGVYSYFIFGEAPRRVRIILLDNRTMRDAYGDPLHQDMLGEAQWKWLENVLRTTEAEVTFIGTGLQVISRGDPVIAESWSRLPQSQAKLLALLAATKTEGAILLSGDVHFAELNKVDCAPMGYPLYDFTSSGLTHSWSGFVKSNVVRACLMGATRVGNNIFFGRNLGHISIDWRTTDNNTVLDRNATMIHLSIIDLEEDETAFTHRIPLSELTRHDSYISRASKEYVGNSIGFNGLQLSKKIADDTDLAECAFRPADEGYTSACAAVIRACSPRLDARHTFAYVVGHGIVYTLILGVLASFMVAPMIIWRHGKALPYGPTPWWTAYFAALAGFYTFIRSLQ